jgi:hypothetical protein
MSDLPAGTGSFLCTALESVEADGVTLEDAVAHALASID